MSVSLKSPVSTGSRLDRPGLVTPSQVRAERAPSAVILSKRALYPEWRDIHFEIVASFRRFDVPVLKTHFDKRRSG